MVAGGLHLKDSSEGEISKVITFLRQHGVQKIVPTHCTGKPAQRLMCTALRENCILAREGDVIDL